MSKKLRVSILFLIPTFLASCTAPSIERTSSPTFLSSNSLTITAEHNQTPILTETMSPPTVDLIEFASLPKADYLVYFDNPIPSSPDSLFLSVADRNGEFIGVLSQVSSTNNVSISPNLRYVTMLPQIIDLEANVNEYIDQLQECSMEPPSWAPDSTRFVVSCGKNGNSNLFIFSLVDLSLVQITFFSEQYSARMPSWSPDGAKIAYYAGYNVSGLAGLRQQGLHLLRVECISDHNSCNEDEEGIGLMYPYIWSQDSQYLAGIGIDPVNNSIVYDSISVLTVSNDNTLPLTQYSLSAGIVWMSWAPGDSIAIETGENTVLLSADTGNMQMIHRIPLLSWIRVQ